ncbi:helix-turn-helix domain-containing protein [Streptomyces marincola]|uniref:helix-turn-helix domain-containing protein n=1 Tax=Streptomyces marincola TaxID=2878388 RepID=UPI001CF33142|nr:AraC family transcriptional regulator [Streptomyces marincola]UCM91473.1 AraC family transcriptional regulator [Streptomyces marincola]
MDGLARRRDAAAPAETRSPEAGAPGAAEVVPFTISSEAETLRRATRWTTHEHPVHELIWSARGVLSITIGRRLWALPSRVGLWIPAGVPHAGSAADGTRYHASFFAPSASADVFREPVCLDVAPLLHELLIHLGGPGLTPDARSRAEAVAFDLLRPARRRHHVVLPDDPRLRAIAEAVAADPADGRALGDWAAELGVSTRTLARAFAGTTGMGFTAWRAVLRVHAALALLSEGTSVAEVAQAVGYSSPSAFTAAFRRVTGRTPSTHQGATVSETR